MQKILGIICGTLIVCAALFGAGYMQGRKSGVSGMESLVAEYRSNVEQLERDLGSARRDSEAIRARTIEAQNAIDSGARGLEESLVSITKLGSVTAQIRGLAQAIRDHVESLRSTASVLSKINSDLGNIVPPDVGN